MCVIMVINTNEVENSYKRAFSFSDFVFGFVMLFDIVLPNVHTDLLRSNLAYVLLWQVVAVRRLVLD